MDDTKKNWIETYSRYRVYYKHLQSKYTNISLKMRLSCKRNFFVSNKSDSKISFVDTKKTP